MGKESASFCPISLATVKMYSYCHRRGSAGWDSCAHIGPQRQAASAGLDKNALLLEYQPVKRKTNGKLHAIK